MKNYLVTGGAGFIGSNFVLYMLEKYEDIRIINVDALTYAGNLENLHSISNNKRHIFRRVDICDRAAIQEIFDTYDIDVVVHFAAESHVDRSIENPMVFVETNVCGTANLLEIAKNSWQDSNGKFANHKFVHVSTDEVYGSLQETGYFVEETPLDPHSPYSASKAASDLMVKAYFDTYGLPINITRCSNNYGPYQFPEKLIPLIIHNALNKKNLPVYGDGLNVRDWLYVKDHCKAIDIVANKGICGQVYNIGGHNERTNIDIVKTIVDYLNKNVDKAISQQLITYVQDRLGHDKRYAIDPKKITSELGWQPETCFEDGILLTIDWYLNNADWVEKVTSGKYQEYYAKMYGKKAQLDLDISYE